MGRRPDSPRLHHFLLPSEGLSDYRAELNRRKNTACYAVGNATVSSERPGANGEPTSCHNFKSYDL